MEGATGTLGKEYSKSKWYAGPGRGEVFISSSDKAGVSQAEKGVEEWTQREQAGKASSERGIMGELWTERRDCSGRWVDKRHEGGVWQDKREVYVKSRI